MAENTLEEYLSPFPDEEHYDRAMEYIYHRLVAAEYKVKEVVAFFVSSNENSIAPFYLTKYLLLIRLLPCGFKQF